MTVHTWSQTALSNQTADTSINWREGQAASTFNDSARAMMAAIAKWRDDSSGNLETGGTASAFTIASNQGFASLADGITVTARMHARNNASATLNVNSLGAKSIANVYGGGIAGGALPLGSIQTFTYDATDDKWIVHGRDEIAALARTDGAIIVGDGTRFVLESGDTARVSLGLGSTSNPQFATIELGHATDATIARSSAGNISIEGNVVYRAGGTDVAVGDGGTGSSTAAGARTAFDVPQMPSGTKSLFQQTSAPTGWTKDTSYNNHALRVTTGAAGDGGTMAFTTAFSARTILSAYMPTHTHSLSASGTTSSDGAHTHTITLTIDSNEGGFSALGAGGGGSTTTVAAATNSGGAHTHTVTVTGTSGSAGAGDPMPFDVQYVDVIIASLN